MPLIRRVAFVVVCCLLAGCFIQQDPPSVQSGPAADALKYKGMIQMAEIRVLHSGAAAVLAAFNQLLDPGSSSRAQARTEEGYLPPLDKHMLDRASFQPWSQFLFVDPREVSRGGICQKLSGKRPDSRLAARESAEKLGDPIAMGNLSFGVANQTKFTSMPYEPSDLTYGLALNPPVPPGEYTIRSDGNKALGVKAFEISFAMPEALTSVRMNGHLIDRSGVEFSKSQPLQIQWDALSIPNDQSGIGLILISEDPMTRHIVACAGLENEVASFDANGQPTWTIDPSWLSDLFDGDGTQVYLTREFVGRAEGAGLRLDMESIRKWMSIAIVRP